MSPSTWLRRWQWRFKEWRFRARFAEFLNHGKPKEHDHTLLLSAFLASQGKSLTWANQELAQTVPKVDFAVAPDTLGCGGDPAVVDAAVSALRSEGYFLMPFSLPSDMQEALISHLSSQECRLVSDDPTVNGKTESINWNAPQAEVYQIEEADVVADPVVQRLLVDRTLLLIAQEYLGVQPSVTNAMAWFTFPRADASDEAAQMFHFDLERIKWLKVFFFLTDVTDESGPHVFIPSTHHDSAVPWSLLDFGYDRMPDDVIASHFPRDQWKTMTGPRGCILLEDTRGLHKGTKVLRDHRLVLQFQYSSSFFGSDCAFARGYPAQCEDWTTISRNYPRLIGPHVT